MELDVEDLSKGKHGFITRVLLLMNCTGSSYICRNTYMQIYYFNLYEKYIGFNK